MQYIKHTYTFVAKKYAATAQYAAYHFKPS